MSLVHVNLLIVVLRMVPEVGLLDASDLTMTRGPPVQMKAKYLNTVKANFSKGRCG